MEIITHNQQRILTLFHNSRYLTSHFYFTGGTALSLYYLRHRESEDLDFFSEKRFDFNEISSIVDGWSKNYHFKVTLRQIENLNAFMLDFPNKTKLKVDFAYYPHRRVEKSNVLDGIEIDSLIDIAVNKLNTVIQRTEVKDFVDLYFLLKKFTIWDLIEGIRIKFGYKVERILIAADFMKAEKFTFLPKMLIPLTLTELQNFFKKKAVELAKEIVE